MEGGVGKLFPDVIGGAVRPTRQEVYYFEAPSDRFHVGHLPIWVDFGKRIVYGMPGIDGRWFKIADDTRGATVDPTTMKRTGTPAGISSARAFLAERFPAQAVLTGREVPKAFRIDRLPALVKPKTQFEK